MNTGKYSTFFSVLWRRKTWNNDVPSFLRAGTRINPDEMTFKGQRRKKNDGEAAAHAAAPAAAEAIVTQQPCADVSDDDSGDDFHAKIQG